MLKQQIYLTKSKKSMSIFRHVTSGIHWKMLTTFFLCFIAGECHGIVNIYYLVRAINMWDSVSFAVHNEDFLKNEIKCVTLNSCCRRCLKIIVIKVFLQLSTKIFFFFLCQCASAWKSAFRSHDILEVKFADIHKWCTFAFGLSRCRFTPGFAHVKINFYIIICNLFLVTDTIHTVYAWGRDALLWSLVYRDWSTGKWMTQVVSS